MSWHWIRCFIVCPKSILSNLLVLSGAFPFLFATNLFPQYRLNCFLRVQKHRSAEGILDICRRGEERQTAKQKYSKYTKLQIKIKQNIWTITQYTPHYTCTTPIFIHRSLLLQKNRHNLYWVTSFRPIWKYQWCRWLSYIIKLLTDPLKRT